MRQLGAGRVVDAGRVDVEYLLVEAPFRRADAPDALEQLVEVVRMALARRIREPLVVHGETLHQVLCQPRRGPLPELRPSMASHAVPDGEDGGQAVVAQAARYFAGALGSNL